jgi:16S rRNA (cytidine1402-2'-O)-methyltransferase
LEKTAMERSGDYVLNGARISAPPLAPGLYVVATPIGNLRDMTLRALETLARADAILAEDTRVTRQLTTHFGVSTPLIAYHAHNADRMRAAVLARLQAGERLALVSDAGTPLVSDPGCGLVADAIAAGAQVYGLPGASAALTALVVAGLPTDRFLFEGFLPQKSGPRRARAAELATIPATLVFYESPRRLGESLADLLAALGDRPAAVARELTKKFEEVRRGSLSELARAYAAEEAPRGEVVIVVGPPAAGRIETAADDLDARLRAALARHSVKDAASVVSGQTGRPRREVYARALVLAQEAREVEPAQDEPE